MKSKRVADEIAELAHANLAAAEHEFKEAQDALRDIRTLSGSCQCDKHKAEAKERLENLLGALEANLEKD